MAERTRDAQVALYLTEVVAKNAALARASPIPRLYEYLLLDVNVMSAVPTSRLVEACSSVQTYVNRALQGLEPGVSFANNDKRGLQQAWEIARHYRIWEANQKLQRYPGNYIEPELRYKKSPMFQNLEAVLGSGEINEDTIQTAIYQYMEALQRVSELTVCGFAKEEVPGERLTFHFVGAATGSRSSISIAASSST